MATTYPDYNSLLNSLGFPAAGAAGDIMGANRDLATQTGQINFQSGLDRNALLGSQEGNGTLNSGETGTKLTNLATNQQYQLQGAQNQAADKIQGAQDSVAQAEAQQQLAQAQLQMQAQEFQQQQANAWQIAQLQYGQTAPPNVDWQALLAGNSATSGPASQGVPH